MNVDPAVLTLFATVVGGLVSGLVFIYRQRSADMDRMQAERVQERKESAARIAQLEEALDAERKARVATAEGNIQWALGVQKGANEQLDKLDAIARALNSRGGRG